MVREAFTDYRYSIVRLSPQTQREYISKLKVFVEWCKQEGIGLEGVRQVTIRRIIEQVRTQCNPHTGKPISSLTVKGYTVVLKTFLTWLSKEDVYEDVVSRKVASRIELPKVEQKVKTTVAVAHI